LVRLVPLVLLDPLLRPVPLARPHLSHRSARLVLPVLLGPLLPLARPIHQIHLNHLSPEVRLVLQARPVPQAL